MLYGRTRALDDLVHLIYLSIRYGYIKSRKFWPRVGYCHCCRDWAWLTNETPAYSAHDGSYLCGECAEVNDRETDYAWRDYYSGR